MAKSYILKRREYTGMYETRSSFGTRKGLSFGKWKMVGKFDSLEEACSANINRSGLAEHAVFYDGKKVCEV